MAVSKKIYGVTSGRAQADKKLHDQRKEPQLAEQLLIASKETGKGLLKCALEYRRLSKGRGRLTPSEYIEFGAYKADPDEQERFISAYRIWPIVNMVNDRSLHGLTEDKWLANHFLELGGIPHIPIHAMIDGSDRHYFGTPVIKNAEELVRFLDEAEFPIFGKHNSALWSIGVLRIDSWSDGVLSLSGGERLAPEEFLRDWIGEEPYLLQPVIKNHSDLISMSDGLITVRVGFFRLEDGTTKIPAAAIKIPRGGNIADNFWRADNTIASVDPESGELGVFRSRVNGRLTEVSPEEISAQTKSIPFWNKMQSLTDECAKVFHHINYGSLDVAITYNGPLIVEVNTGGAWELYQIASQKGFLTDEVLDLFQSYGAEI